MRLLEYARTGNGETVNSNLYYKQLDRINQEPIKNGVDSTKTRLLHDNAKTYVSKKYSGARLDSFITALTKHHQIIICLSQLISRFAICNLPTCAKMGGLPFNLQAHRVLQHRDQKPTRKMQGHNSFTGKIYID